MRTTIIPIDQVEARGTKEAHRVNIFDTCSTAECLLDCNTAKARYGLASQRATNGAEKREKRQGFVALEKNKVQSQRQNLEADHSRIANSALKLKRSHFALKELEASSKNGCGSCRFLLALIDSLFQSHSVLGTHRHSVELQWVGHSFNLQIQEKVTGRAWMFQFFSPTGEYFILV